MNIAEKLFGYNGKVIVYMKSDSMMSKTVCRKRDLAKHIADSMIFSNEQFNIRIMPYKA